MADSSFLQAALSLLGRPGNAVRGALIDGPGGFGQGLAGSRQYDPTELPGVNQLPDEGPSLGPVHLTPRTVAGFGASALLDPLTYAGGLLGRGVGALGHLGAESGDLSGLLGRGGAEGLGSVGLGRDAAYAAETAGTSGAPMAPHDSQSLEDFLNWNKTSGAAHPELTGRYQGGVTQPHFLDALNGRQAGSQIDPDTADLGELIAHTNAKHGLNITLEGQDLPSNIVTKVGDQEVASAKDATARYAASPATVQGDERFGLNTEHKGTAIVSDPKTIQQLARQYLDYTADAPPDDKRAIIQQLHDALTEQLGAGPDSIGGTRGSELRTQIRDRQDATATRNVGDEGSVSAQAQRLLGTTTGRRDSLSADQMGAAQQKAGAAIRAESQIINTREQPWYTGGGAGMSVDPDSVSSTSVPQAAPKHIGSSDLAHLDGSDSQWASGEAATGMHNTSLVAGRNFEVDNPNLVANAGRAGMSPELLMRGAARDMENRRNMIADLERAPGPPQLGDKIDTRTSGTPGYGTHISEGADSGYPNHVTMGKAGGQEIPESSVGREPDSSELGTSERPERTLDYGHKPSNPSPLDEYLAFVERLGQPYYRSVPGGQFPSANEIVSMEHAGAKILPGLHAGTESNFMPGPAPSRLGQTIPPEFLRYLMRGRG